VGGDQFKIVTSLFKGKLRQFLSDNGWRVNRDFSPSAAPTYAEGMGRNLAEGPVKSGPGMAQRFLYIILAIAVFIFAVFLKMQMSGPHR
jgi:hypothetical protein